MTIDLAGDFGKPRPALVIQSDRFDQTGTCTVLLISSTLVDAPLIRITIDPTPANGLERCSRIMVDKAMFVKRSKMSDNIGQLDADMVLAVTRSLAVFFAVT